MLISIKGNFGSQQNNGLCNSCFSKQKSNTVFQPNNNDTILEDNWFKHLAGKREKN
jgi:hypothetical protein